MPLKVGNFCRDKPLVDYPFLRLSELLIFDESNLTTDVAIIYFACDFMYLDLSHLCKMHKYRRSH